MTRTGRKSWRQWAPAGIAAGAVGAAALVAPFTANAAVDLPDKTAAEVLLLVQDKNVDAFSGTVEQSSNLGLPDLSVLDSAGTNDDGGEPSPASAAVELLTGSHTAQVFVNGPDQARLQVLDQLEERNVVRNGDDLWYYNSDENEAIHATLEEHDKPDGGGTHAPSDVAAHFLEKIDPSTEVTVGSDRMVAGRAVYDLILTPRSTETLVGSVSIAVDGETGLPLGVTVSAGSSDPAFSSTFTEISYEEPSADLFAFAPPDGATVTEVEPSEQKREHAQEKTEAKEKPTVVGEGWDAVVVVPAGQQEVPPELTQLSTPVDGGQLLSTTLVNVLITDDGRILAGSVPVERLQAVASGQ